MTRSRTVILVSLAAILGACGGIPAATAGDAQSEIDKRSNATKPFVPAWPSPEYKNYDRAQKLYADPNTIQWCTTTWGNSSAPLVTVPIAGKLTSSSVSFFPGSRTYTGGGDDVNEHTPERRSVDGMYHGSPPPYRYGFTPGGQYVDFSAMPVFCSTKPLKFQREKTEIALSVDQDLEAATQKAEAALKSGDTAGATSALTDALGSSK